MAWVFRYVNSSIELSLGMTGWFNFASVGGRAHPPVEIVDDPAPTATRIQFVAPNFSSKITITGENLAATELQGQPAGLNIPVLTQGRVTGIRYEFNYKQKKAADQGIFDPALNLPSLLELAAVITLPSVPARAISDAIVGSFVQGTPQVFLDFVAAQGGHFLNGSARANTIIGTDAGDTLRGFRGNDALDGGAGDDVIDGGRGSDVLAGGPGNDLFLPGPSNVGMGQPGDSISDNGTRPGEIDMVSYANAPGAVVVDLATPGGAGGAGWARGLIATGIEGAIGSRFDDLLIGTDQRQSIQDDAGNLLRGGEGDDTLRGLGGSDVLEGGPGFDLLQGGPNGTIAQQGPGDVARYDVPRGAVDLFVGQGGAVFVSAPGLGLDTLQGMEFIQTFAGVERIEAFGLSRANLVVGDGQGQTLAGGMGRDIVLGRAGADTLLGRAGGDRMEGGRGNDLMRGHNGSDDLRGEEGRDRVLGGPGSDRVDGGRGADIVNGQRGNDTVLGGLGDDRLFGAEGADVLEGGRGRDALTGGKGRDVFVLNDGDGRDTVRDFQAGETLALDDGLWGGGLGAQGVVREFARATDFGWRLDFGDDRLDVRGDLTRAQLVEAIDLF